VVHIKGLSRLNFKIIYKQKKQKSMNYKKASRLGLRFYTKRGMLSVEQLWHLSLKDLSEVIKEVKKTISENTSDDELGFLDENIKTDDENTLRFDILKDVYLTVKEERETLRKEAEDKEHNQKILELIKEKKEGQLRDMSVEELESMLK
jgi:hypothetical protein